MAVYFIANYDVTDPESYQAYVQATMPIMIKHGGQALAADMEAKAMEGKLRHMNLILKFDSEEKAMAWYNDPDYQALKKQRQEATTNAYLVLTQEFVPPQG